MYSKTVNNMPKTQTTRLRKSPRNTLSLQQLHALPQGPQEEETRLRPLTAQEEKACLALSPEIQELFKAAMTVGDFNDEVEPTSAENVHRIVGWRPETQSSTDKDRTRRRGCQ